MHKITLIMHFVALQFDIQHLPDVLHVGAHISFGICVICLSDF